MQHLTMIFGLGRACFGGDYRSQSQRHQLRRLGREFLNEELEAFSKQPSHSAEAGLEDHPNALVRQ